MYRIRAAFVEEFALADEERDCQLVSTSTVAVRKQDERQKSRLCGKYCFSDLAGVEDV